MKTLYIHIGCPKTATTSIQYFCNENKEILSKNGVYFPIFEQKYKDVNPYRNGHFLIAHQYDSNGKINIRINRYLFFKLKWFHVTNGFNECFKVTILKIIFYASLLKTGKLKKF
jgi:hypothetical protein